MFKPQTSLLKMNKVKLIESVKLVGEGKGRLTLGQSQFVFSFDS